MAKSGDILEHPVTGERLVWRKVARDTGGELLQADLYVAPGGFVAAEHVHPVQEERFEVLAGVLRLHIDGKEKTMRTGEIEVVPAGRPHVWWNGARRSCTSSASSGLRSGPRCSSRPISVGRKTVR